MSLPTSPGYYRRKVPAVHRGPGTLVYVSQGAGCLWFEQLTPQGRRKTGQHVPRTQVKANAFVEWEPVKNYQEPPPPESPGRPRLKKKPVAAKR